MSIKWSYYILAVIYLLVISLRLLNSASTAKFKRANKGYKSTFSIKKDFFVVVTVGCIIVTSFINIAALVGGRPLNKQSILITLLITGVTLINSWYTVLFVEEEERISYLGYEIKKGEVESIKVREGRFKTKLYMVLNREVDSYNDVKMTLYGEHRKSLVGTLKKMSTKDV